MQFVGGGCQRHAMPLSLYPPILYLQVSDHIATVWVVKIMLFIGTTFYVTHWRIFIQRYRYCMCQYWRCCGPHLFTLFRTCHSRFRMYLYGVMMCVAGLSLPMRDSILSVFVFVKFRDALISCSQAIYFPLVGIPIYNGSGFPNPDKSFVWQAEILPQYCGVRGGHLVSDIRKDAAV